MQRPTPTEALLLHDPDHVDDDGVIARLERAHAAMGRALRQCGPALQCWTIWPAPSSYIFWVRRMLHETVIHRVDVQNAGQLNTSTGTDLETQIAADGVDEMICGFAQRYSVTLRLDHPATIVFNPSELNQTWWGESARIHRNSGGGTGPRIPTPRSAHYLASCCCCSGTAAELTDSRSLGTATCWSSGPEKRTCDQPVTAVALHGLRALAATRKASTVARSLTVPRDGIRRSRIPLRTPWRLDSR